MGKNKRKHPSIDEMLERPWCYYCERDFDDLKILINHQKAKHYKCDKCGRRLNTAGGLSVHMTQVHKESLTAIENALPNRAGLEHEIFGMEGIPDDVRKSHEQRMLQNFAQSEAERRASTGNHAQGSDGAPKKPKIEAPSDLKKRLAEHKAKKAAEEAAGIKSGGNTPGGMADATQSPGPLGTSASPSYPQQQQPFGAPPIPPFQGQPQPYGQQPPFPQQSSPPPFASPQQAFSPPGMPQYPTQQPFAPPQQFGPPGQGPPPQFQSGPPQFHNGPPQFSNGPQQFQNGPPQQFQGGPQFLGGPPQQFQNGPPQFHNGPPFQNGPPQQYGPGSPGPFQQNQFQPPIHNAPPQFNVMPQRPGSLPPAPSLPQRPAVAAPQVNFQQMQQMHQGQHAGAPLPLNHPAMSPQGQGAPGAAPANASSLDDLVSGAAKDADKAAVKKDSNPETPTQKGKKEKDSKSMKLMYSDNETSPEEKMARMPRYAFTPAAKA